MEQQAENISELIFSRRLREVMDQHGLTQAQLAAATGVTQGAVSGWLQGSVPKGDVLFRIAQVVGVQMESLLSESTLPPLAATTQPAGISPHLLNHAVEQLRAVLVTLENAGVSTSSLFSRHRSRVNKIKPAAKEKRGRRPFGSLSDVASISLALFGEMGAGPAIAPSDEPIGYVSVARGQFPADAFCARVNGSSMDEAGVQNGDIVVLRWAEQQEAQPGDLVCVHLFGDGSVLKKLVEREDGRRWLVSRNPAYPDICLDADGEPKGRIQAVMIGRIDASSQV